MSEKSEVNFKAILITLWITNIFSPFLISGVNALLPAMGSEFNASAMELSLILLFFNLAQVIFSLFGGKFGDFWGQRRVICISVTIFFVSSLGIALSYSLTSLLVWRFIQGMAVATLASCCTVIGISLASPEERGKVIGILVSAVYLGLSVGPLVCGYVATVTSWRYAFWGIFFLGIPLLGLLYYNLRSPLFAERLAAGERFDFMGAGLLSLSLCSFAFATSSFKYVDFAVWFFPFSFIVFAFFIRQQWFSSFPTINIRILKDVPGFSIGILAIFLNYSSILGLIYYFVLYLQEIRGFSPFMAASFLVFQSFMQAIASPIGGKLGDRYNPHFIAALGMLLCAIGIFALSFLTKESSLTFFIIWLVAIGFGIGVFNAPNMMGTVAHVPKKQLSIAIGLTASARTMGALTSQAFITVLITFFLGNQSVLENVPRFFDSMHISFLCFAFLNIISSIMSAYYSKKHSII